MPNVTVNVGDAVAPVLLEAAEESLAAQGINYGSMTPVQKIRSLAVSLLRDVYLSRRKVQAEMLVKNAIDTSVAEAETEASGIT